MKVCLLAPELIPNRGGVGSYSACLLRSASDRVEFTVLTLQRYEGTQTRTEEQLRSEFGPKVDLKVVSVARDSFVYNMSFQLAILRAMRKLAPEGGFDLIHSQHAHMPDLFSGVMHSTPPTIRTIHTTIAGQREAIEIAQRAGSPMDLSLIHI